MRQAVCLWAGFRAMVEVVAGFKAMVEVVAVRSCNLNINADLKRERREARQGNIQEKERGGRPREGQLRQQRRLHPKRRVD